MTTMIDDQTQADSPSTSMSQPLLAPQFHVASHSQVTTDHPGPPSKSAETSFSEKEPQVVLEMVSSSTKPIIYKVSEVPPLPLLMLFAMQQSLLAIANPLSNAVIVAEVVCATNDDVIKAQLLSATLLMTGLATFLMPAVGVRLPIFQGPAASYMVPLVSLISLAEWKCPPTFEDLDPATNKTAMFAIVGNGSVVLLREVIFDKISQLSGSLMAAGVLHFLIGFTGFVGVIIRYVGPVTVVPTVILVGLEVKNVAVKFSESNWTVAIITAGSSLLFSIFLSNHKTPIPFWNRKRGFHLVWYPLHQVFSILLGILIGWAASAVMTVTGALSSDPNNLQFMARTDARSHVIEESGWLILPYPGMFGVATFSIGGFISFFVATILSVLDSIGDYSACARTARVPPPPAYAFNRGIAVEGLVSFLGGALGCCHATSSYGGNIGAMGITRVMSRSVFQLAGLIYVVFAIFGKFGAVFISIPYPVLGGTNIVIMGIFIGVILSYLQMINLNSTRNLAIIGIAILLGVMMPLWVSRNPAALRTGNATIDSSLKMLLSNTSFVGGVFAFFMDNTTPGTLKERGLLQQLEEITESSRKSDHFVEGLEIYDLPYLPDCIRRSKLAKYIPIFGTSKK